MIGWLQGHLQDPWQQANRCGLLLICQGVGYEVQVSQRLWALLPPPGTLLTLFVHHLIREDGWTLFGFESRHERELFREVVAVNGVGPQMGLALLGAMAPQELITAIVEGQIRLLTQAPGVGKRTAERLCLELRQRCLDRFADWVAAPDWAQTTDGVDPATADGSLMGQDLQAVLLAMGYDKVEILGALRAVAEQGVDSNRDWEQLLGDCLRWLSRGAA